MLAVNPLFRTVLTLTVESHWPDEKAALGGAADLMRELRASLNEDERLVKSAVMVRRARTDGEKDD